MFVNVPIGLVVLVLARRVVAETERRHGRFDLLGAVTSTAGTTAVVFGLVQAGNDGWANPITLGAFTLGLGLLAVFVSTESRAEEPILPLRLFAHSTRTTANAARGLVYAGMYGMFFFMSQFFQDVQGFSPLRAGVAFLPMPASVFLASQLTSRVLIRRFSEKALMVAGAAPGEREPDARHADPRRHVLRPDRRDHRAARPGLGCVLREPHLGVARRRRAA